MLIRSGIALALLVLFVYGIIKTLPLIAGPSITITSPANGQTFQDGFVTIQGTAHHADNLLLNDGTLLIDESGHFATSLFLPHGSAILSLTASDQFGRSRTERRTVFIP